MAKKTKKQEIIAEDKKILFVGAEAMPFAASGGLGDVLGSLPAAVRCVIACFFEMTSGTAAAAEMLPPDIAFVAAAWAAGWSRVSVHAQTSLVTGGKTGGRYVAGKALTSLLSALFAAAALKTGLI